jgi:hypothetical protein
MSIEMDEEIKRWTARREDPGSTLLQLLTHTK